ncbi:MAG: hypothetical protein QOF71_2281 [Candidatus Eremiobacteraeota bacterium]|jgi:hypothetical protein|nr:hypothetical protein [Candidatus Eremiobacteraeota bacterium]
MTDEDARAFFAWAEREKVITRLMYAGKLGFGELALRRQMNYDRLLAETASQPKLDLSSNQ